MPALEGDTMDKKMTSKRMQSPAAQIQERTDALVAASQALYQSFAGYRSPSVALDACVTCCMDADLEREMRRLPLRSLTEHHFYQYNDAAKSVVQDRKSTRLNSSHLVISYAVFCLKKKENIRDSRTYVLYHH